LSTARNIGGEDLGQVTSIRQVGVAAFMGAMIEWYDFFLYGLAAAVVFNQLFFPSEVPLAGTLVAFATFGVGFFFRPVRGIIFGHYGQGRSGDLAGNTSS
jgi:MFS transporter, MHS family, shikimate and dehydroshikimate transport protein